MPIAGWYLSSERVLKRSLRRRGASIPPLRKPRVSWLNMALKSGSDVERALAEVRACGLPPHIDRPKNWDALCALKAVLDHTEPSSSVLDVGATLYSVTLPWLYLYDYRDLTGIDLAIKGEFNRGPIRYACGDICSTNFENARFDAIVCQSVIEHGVDTDLYLREVSRILRPSGILVTSTDYWESAIDTQGQQAYGQPVKVFVRGELEELLEKAAEYGLYSTGPVALECEEKVVYWRRLKLRYTFVCFALRKH